MIPAGSQLKRPTRIWSFNLMRRPPTAPESRNILSFTSASQAFRHNNQPPWIVQSFLQRPGISVLPLRRREELGVPRCSFVQLAPRFCPQTASPILHMNISRWDGPIWRDFRCGPWRRRGKGRTQRRLVGRGGDYENGNNHEPPTAPLMLHDCAYTRKIKAYQNITPIFALCMREIVYDTLFDINCTFGRREMKDAGRKLWSRVMNGMCSFLQLQEAKQGL